MARTNMNATRVKPAQARLQTMHVVRQERISASFARVTLGGGDISLFTPMGADQWFRLFLPVSEDSLSRLPSTLDTLAYLRYLAIAKTERPVLRNYTVRAFRGAGTTDAELDIDFVLHGSADDATSGPAALWAQTCRPGDAVALLDEGVGYNPPPALARSVALVADETALPAAAGILEYMPRDARGTAVIEIPTDGDRQEIDAPEGVAVHWVARHDASATPGVAALAAATELPVPGEPVYGWAAGEQALPVAMRRHWVRAGVPKDAISFCGYWRSSARH